MRKSLKDLVYEHECHLENKAESAHVLYCFDAVQLLKQVRAFTIKEIFDKLFNEKELPENVYESLDVNSIEI